MWEQIEKLVIRKINGTKDIKRALDKKYTQIEYQKQVKEAFASWNKPPLMLTEDERKGIRNLIQIIESRKAKGIVNKNMSMLNLGPKMQGRKQDEARKASA